LFICDEVENCRDCGTDDELGGLDDGAGVGSVNNSAKGRKTIGLSTGYLLDLMSKILMVMLNEGRLKRKVVSRPQQDLLGIFY